MRKRESAATGQNFCLRVDEMIQEMCEKFVDKYFWEDADMHVVWADIPGIMAWPLLVNDYYFSLEDVYAALWYDMPLKCVTDYQDYKDDVIYNGAVDYNLKSFYHLIYKTDASEDKSEKKENGYWPMTDRPHQRPQWWISQWPTAIWPFVWGYPYSPDWYPTTITLCSATRECRSVKLPSTDDTNDVTAKWNDENDGWKDEEARRESEVCCWRRGCERTWSHCPTEWRQCSKLQQRNRRGVRWSNK